MIRKALLMHVHPDAHAEYARRHQPIPDELAETLRAHGVSNYSIFLDAERHLLFAYAEIESEARWEAIAATPACQKWWAHIRDLMPTDSQNRPLSEPLREVFHLD